MTACATTVALSERLVEVLSTVDHTPGSLQVAVGEDRLDADSSRDLRQTLSGHLYHHWHTRLAAAEDTKTRFYRDAEFEQILAAHTPMTTALRQGTLVPGSPEPAADGSPITVVLDGVRVVVPAASVVRRANRNVTLRVDARRPSLSPGFFLVDGSRGRFAPGTPPLRVYLSIARMESAPPVWHTVLTALEHGGHHYRAKIGSAPRLYPRADAFVVYLDGANLDLWDGDGSGAVADIVRAVDNDPDLGTHSSVFARPVARGVALASEPADPRVGMSRMSFGQHRCYAVATGILDTTSDADMFVRVHDALVAASVDPADPSRNRPVLASAQPGRDSTAGGAQP